MSQGDLNNMDDIFDAFDTTTFKVQSPLEHHAGMLDRLKESMDLLVFTIMSGKENITTFGTMMMLMYILSPEKYSELAKLIGDPDGQEI